MIFYDTPSPAPNPRRVRIFAAEKGINLPTQTVSLMAREHKSAEHLARNPLGQVPVLVLDDGTAISETVAICRYLEALHPQPPLFGTTALENSYAEALLAEAEGQRIAGGTADAMEGGLAFLQKRKPEFKGA